MRDQQDPNDVPEELIGSIAHKALCMTFHAPTELVSTIVLPSIRAMATEEVARVIDGDKHILFTFPDNSALDMWAGQNEGEDALFVRIGVSVPEGEDPPEWTTHEDAAIIIDPNAPPEGTTPH